MVYCSMSAYVSIWTPFPIPITSVLRIEPSTYVTWQRQRQRRELGSRCLQPLADVIITFSEMHLRKCNTNPGPMQSLEFC